MELGLEVLLKDKKRLKHLKSRRVAILAHPASVDAGLRHAMDALAASGVRLAAAFGPQHGMRGDKQDNMVETDDDRDPVHGFPVFSLYGRTRTPTPQALETFDVLLVDLQDVGTRVYTFITTLKFMMEACAKTAKEVWILDRPNPAGRPVEGTMLEEGQESFVGAAPMVMRHGLTLGELAPWYVRHFSWDLDLKIVPMRGYAPHKAPGFGWPLLEREWVNPSPNAPNLSMVRCYPGTVMLEGTTLSEGRGTTRPLEMWGAPDIKIDAILKRMHELAPKWLAGGKLRPCFFEPTFHKHVGKLCHGVQWHVAAPHYQHAKFKPFRGMALFFKALKLTHPDYPLWRDFPYEYETTRLAIDVINGGSFLREWVDDPSAKPGDLEARLKRDEKAWAVSSRPFLRYR